MNKIGDILRDARIKEKLSFDDVVEKTGIPPHYLLAMELDQLKLLPNGKVNEYLEKYASAVGLDPISIIHGYRNQEVGDLATIPASANTGQFILADEDSEELSQSDFEESLQLEKTPIEVPGEEEVAAFGQTAPEILLEEESPQEETVAVAAEDFSEKEDKPFPSRSRQSLPSRLSKHDEDDEDDEPKHRFPWVLILLTIIALGILSYVGYIVYNQLNSGSNSQQTVSTKTKTSSSQETTTANQAVLTNDFDQGGDTVTLTNAGDQVEINFSLTGEQDSWVSATNTAQGEAGTTLSSSESSFTTSLAQGATNSVITVSMVDMVTLTINGQVVDLTPLATSGMVTINLVVE